MYKISKRQLLSSAAVLSATAALAPVTGGLFSIGPANAAGQLVVTSYGGRYERYWREALLPPFEEATDIQATVDVGIGVNWAANLRATGPDAPAYSFVMMNDLVGAMLREEGFFKSWPKDKVPNLEFVHPKAIIGDQMGVTGMVSPIGIAYRTDLVKTPPTSWKDLFENSEFKGKLGLFEISNNAGYMFVMMISQIFGKGPMDTEVGISMIEKLKPFPTGGLAGALSVLLTQGEIIACPLDIGEVINLQKKGAPIAFAIPKEGMFMFDQTFNLLRAAPNEDAACAFLNYILSEEVQVKLANEFSFVPVNTKAKLPPELAESLILSADDLDQILTFDWIAANANRDAVTEMWNRMVR